MYPVILQIGAIKIYSYGLMMAMAFLVAGFLLRRELERVGLAADMGDLIVIGAVLGGVIGAKYSIIESLGDPDTLSLRLIFSGAGLVWYGGFIGGTIAVLAIIRLKRAPLLKVLDLLAPMMILGYAFGRMGCFLSGDGCYGPPTDLPWGMAFPNGIVSTLERVHPAPLYEITMSLAIFAFLWKVRRRITPAGWNFGLYLILAGTERFIAEFWRRTPVVVLGLTMAQFLGIVSIAAGTVMVLYPRREQPTIT
jgi:phosphatidylglycerol:prolipoprotein diacylglycerol transferase